MGLQRVGDDRATKQKRNIAWRICMSVYVCAYVCVYRHVHTQEKSKEKEDRLGKYMIQSTLTQLKVIRTLFII